MKVCHVSQSLDRNLHGASVQTKIAELTYFAAASQPDTLCGRSASVVMRRLHAM